MPSRRRRSRRSLGTKISYMNSSVVRSAQTSVPNQLGEQSITDDALVQGAIVSQYISPSAIDSTKFSMSTRLPSGEGAQRVPSALSDRTYWSQVVAGDIELHATAVHGEGGELEDITNVEATNIGLKFVPTADEPARIYLTGRMPIPQSRKVYATWTGNSSDLEVKLIWWKNNPILDVETAKMEQGIVQLGLSTESHGLAELDTIQVTGTSPDFDGIYTVLKTSGTDIYYVPTISSINGTVLSAAYTASNSTAVLTLDATGGFNGQFDQDGVLYVSGLGAPFDGMFVIGDVDSTYNTISYTLDYSTDTTLPSTNAPVILYPADTSEYLSEIFLAPTGKVSKDEYVYVPLQDREIWGADGYTIRLYSSSLTNNVASLTTYTPTYLRVGDTVTVFGVDASDAATSVFDGTFTVTSVSTDTKTFTYASVASNVATNTLATAAYVVTKNQDTPSEYAVYVEVPAATEGDIYLYSSKVFEVLGEAKTQPVYGSVTKAALVNNVATLYIPATNTFTSDSDLTVSGLGAPYDGTFTIGSVGSASIYSYEVINSIGYLTVSNTAPFMVGVYTQIVGVPPGDGLLGNKLVTDVQVSRTISSYAVTSGVVTLTLSVGQNVYGLLYSNVNIRGIPALTSDTTVYQVTSVNNATRQVTFSADIADTSGSASGTIVGRTVVVSASGNTTATLPDNATAYSRTISYPVTPTANIAVANVSGAVLSTTGVEHSELTPTGLTLYNADGSISARLSSQDVNTLSIGNAETGQATISDVGDGTFSSLVASDTFTVGGDSILSGNVAVGGDISITGSFTVGSGASGDINIYGNIIATTMAAGSGLYVGGEITTYSISAAANTNVVGTFDAVRLNSVVPISGANTNTTAFGTYTGDYLSRLARGRIYSVGWDMAPTGGTDYTVPDVFTAFASGKLYVEPGRAYLGVVNMGGIRPTVAPSGAYVFELLVSDAAFAVTATTGYRVVSSMLVNAGTVSTDIYAVFASGLTIPFEGTSASQTNNWTKGLMTAVDGSGNPKPTYWMFRGRYTTGAVATTKFAYDAYDGDYQPAEFVIYDMGATNSSKAVLTGTGNTVWAITGTPSGGTTNTTTNTNSAVTTTYTKTVTIGSYNSAYFDNYGLGDGGTSDPYANQESLYQGNPGTSSGTKKSQVAFPALNSTSLSVPTNADGYVAGTINAGYTVTKVELYLRNRHSASASGLTAWWGYSSDINARNSSAPPSPYVSAGQSSSAFTKGQGKYMTLSSTVKNYWAGGQIRSILLGLANASSNAYTSTLANYGYFDGDLQSDPPKLRITYTYTITA